MSEGSSRRMRKPPVIKTKADYLAEGWPKRCRVCNRPTRPVHSKSEDWPDTVQAENKDGDCPRCTIGKYRRSTTTVKIMSAKPHMTHDEEQEMIRRGRADLIQMMESRRRRGVPTGGFQPKGEKPSIEAPLVFADPSAPAEDLGLCPKGHPYDILDSSSHRRCGRCMRENAQKRRAQAADRLRRLAEGEPLGKCSRGHDYDRMDSFGHRRCYKCENSAHRQQRRRARRREADQQHKQLMSA